MRYALDRLSGSFALELKRFSEKYEEEAGEMIQGVEIKLFSAIILDTPVDTGRLRSNWMVSFDNPLFESTLDVDPTGQQTIAEMQSKVLERQSGRLTWFANNLIYAIPIEYGHSKVKAPEGMVRRNVVRFQVLLDEELN